MQPTLDISVLISTYNRADDIAGLLEHLLRQEAEGLSHEIVVVDNNSRDGTREVVERFARQDPRVRYVFEERQGIPYGRNSGVRSARGRLFAFIDDDVRPAPDWLASIHRVARAHPEAGFFGGKVLPDWPSPPPAWITSRAWGPLALTDHGDQAFVIDADRPVILVNASLAVRREVFEKVGLYALDMFLGEDREFQLRCFDAGIRGMYVPEVVVTARIQPERLTHAYHRRWYVKQGEASAKMRLLESYDSQGRYVGFRPSRLALFGVSGYVYREALRYLGRWLRASVRGDRASAYVEGNDVVRLLSYIRARYRHRAQGYSGPVPATERLVASPVPGTAHSGA